MKKTLQYYTAILIISTLAYSACKKAAVKPSATVTNSTLTDKQLATQLVAGLTASFSNVKGVTGAEKTGANATGKVLNGTPPVPNGFCGLSEVPLDTFPAGFNFPYFFDPAVDTLDGPLTGGTEVFTICNNTGPFGYEYYLKLSVAGNAPDGYFFNYLEQDYTVKSLNANYTKFSLEGYLADNDNWAYGIHEDRDTTTYQPGLTFVFTNGRPDITGTATFNHLHYEVNQTTNTNAKTGYYGTYTFTGNFGVTVTFLQSGSPEVYHFTY